MMRIFIAATIIFAACTQEDGESGCPTPLTSDAVTLDVPNTAVTTDVKLTGTITRPQGVTIFRVFVAGIAASNDDADFSRFSVTVPLATLKDLADGNPTASLEVEVETNCTQSVVMSGAFAIDLPAVTGTAPTLTLTPDLPLPTTIAASRLVTLTADTVNAGTSVTFTTTLGTFDSGATTATRTLIGDAPALSHAYATLTSTPKDGGPPTGEGLVTVSGPAGVSLSQSITFVGPPTLTPSAATVTPPAVFSLDLGRSADRTITCRATPTRGFTISYDGAPIMNTQHSASAASANKIGVVVATTAVPKSSATVTCRDDLGQVTTATISIPE